MLATVSTSPLADREMASILRSINLSQTIQQHQLPILSHKQNDAFQSRPCECSAYFAAAYCDYPRHPSFRLQLFHQAPGLILQFPVVQNELSDRAF